MTVACVLPDEAKPSLQIKAAPPLITAGPQVRVAQKLLLAADAPYGRDLEDPLGRPNFVKDRFDLQCLGHEPVDTASVHAAAREDAERKSDYLRDSYAFQTVLKEARATVRHFAHPPADDDTFRGSLWRAYDRVKGGTRVPFTRADLRTTAGCAHHCIQALQQGELDWSDAWRPANDKQPRRAWEDETIVPVIEVEDDYGPAAGPLEAWARFARGRVRERPVRRTACTMPASARTAWACASWTRQARLFAGMRLRTPRPDTRS